MKRRWQKGDRVLLPSQRPAVIEDFRTDGEVKRMLCRYADTLQYETVEIPVTLPRVRAQA